MPKHLAARQLNLGELPVEVVEFGERKGLLGYLGVAADLLRKHFTLKEGPTYGWRKDPETRDQWIAVSFGLSGEVRDLLDHYDRFTDEWVSKIQWPESDKIRFSYDCTPPYVEGVCGIIEERAFSHVFKYLL